MKRDRLRLFLPVFLSASMVLFLILRLLAALFLRSMGPILLFLGERLELGETAQVLGQIFGQLAHAELSLPILCPLAFAMVCGWIPWLGVKTGRASRIVFSVFGSLLLLIPAVLLTIWLTSVNGIRFDGVMLSLIRMIRAGALDSL